MCSSRFLNRIGPMIASMCYDSNDNETTRKTIQALREVREMMEEEHVLRIYRLGEWYAEEIKIQSLKGKF